MKGIHNRFFWRELRAGKAQLALFFICVLLASLSISVVSGWRHSVDDALAEETKKGAGGDVVAFSTEVFSNELLEATKSFEPMFTSEMFTVTLAPSSDLTLFSKLKAVEEGYPYYGQVPLESGRSIHSALKQGLVVEKRVLERLEIKVGDQVKIGDRTFPIADMALSEPDRPLGMWGVSPRIFVAMADLESTGLVGPGSYLERRIHIKLADPETANVVAEDLRKVAVPDQERIETWERPPVNMEKYVENFFTFLDMMVVLAVTLGGLGMQSTLSAWLRGRTKTVAITRTLGAEQSFIYRHYTLIVFFCGAAGYLVGLALAGILLNLSGEYLTQMLPVQVTPSLSVAACLESAFLCFLVSLAFAAWPLYETSLIRPGAVLRDESAKVPRLAKILLITLLLTSVFGLLGFLVGDIKKAFYINAALGVVFLVMGFLTVLIVKFLKNRKPKNLVVRTALGSWRSPEARTGLIVFILSTCLAVLFTAVICSEALRQSWVEAMPPESPNLLFLDIQPDQLEAFEKAVDRPLSIYSNMRVRVLDINGEPLDRSGKREYWERDGRGKLDANPTLELPSNDRLLQGERLYVGDEAEQVSIREDMAEALKVGIGDNITFGIQGVPISATISSIRKSSRKGFKPSFELLFPPKLVEGAPQTVFASARLPEEQIGALQTKLAKAFPSIVSMDLSTTIRLIAERLTQMVSLVHYFLGAGVFAGVLILVSATWSARQRRAKESAFYKVMGAGTGFLHRVIWAENLILGLLCSSLALSVALGVSFLLCSQRLKIDFPEMQMTLLLMLVIPTALIAALGWLVGRKVVEARPALYLREG